MIDLMSRGRLIAGFPVGTSMDTAYAYSVEPGHAARQVRRGASTSSLEGVDRATSRSRSTDASPRCATVNAVPAAAAEAAPADLDPGRRLGRDVGLLRENDYVYGALSYYGHLLAAENVGELLAQRRGERQGPEPATASPSCSSSASPTPTPRPTSSTRSRPSTSSTARCTSTPATPTRPATSPRHRCEPGTSPQVRQIARTKQAEARPHVGRDGREGLRRDRQPRHGPRDARGASRRRSTAGTCSPMLHFGNMSDELTRYNTKLFGDKVAPGTAHDLRRRGRPVVARERDGRLMAGERDLVYLFGIAGHPAPSPAARTRSKPQGWNVVVPSLPGFDGELGLRRTRRLPRLAHGRSGTRSTRAERGCRAPSSARRSAACSPPTWPRYRPEAVDRARPARAVRHLRRRQPGHRPLRRADRRAHGAPVREGRARAVRRSLRELGPDDGPVARYLSDVAAASLLWPLGDRGQASRLHRIRCPRLVAVGRAGRAAAARRVRAVGRGRRPGRGDRRRRAPPRVGRARRGRCPRRGVPPRRAVDHIRPRPHRGCHGSRRRD